MTETTQTIDPLVPTISLPTWLQFPVAILSLVMAAIAIYVAGFGAFDEVFMRSAVIGLSMVLTILSRPVAATYQGKSKFARWLLIGFDILLLVLIAFAFFQYYAIRDKLRTGLFTLRPIDLWAALGGVFVVLVLTKRLFGSVLAAVGLLVLIYGLFGDVLPGFLRHAGFSFSENMRVLWYSFDGVYGFAVGVVLSFVLIFIIFGTVLEGIGTGDALLKIASRATSGLRGGAAHASIVASGIFGTISGDVAGNVVGTGVFTIPMIKRQGFSASFAGGVEAAASTGGQFMPPVMAAVAFIMADLTGIPYLTIAVAAAIPSLLYYMSLFTTVSVEAIKHDIPVVSPELLPTITRKDWLLSICFFVPLFIIIFLLVRGYTTALAGFWATTAALLLGVIVNDDLRRKPRKILDILLDSGQKCGFLLIAVALVGVIVGMFNMTGVGLRFASLILFYANNSLLLALLLMAAGCLVLGMGVPTIPAYLIIILVLGPAIQGLGPDILLVHLFAVYFASLSFVTPPVAIGAIVAAPIANADPIKTALQACRVAFVGFLIPFVFIYNPSMTLVQSFDWPSFLWVMLRTIGAIWLIVTSLAGYSQRPISLPMRLIRFVVGIGMLLITPWLHTTAFVIALLLIGYELLSLRQQNHSKMSTK